MMPQMCPWTDKIQALHDGELRGEQASLARAHVAECAACAEELRQLEALSGAIVGLKSIAPPDEAAMQRWRAALRRQQAENLLLIRLSLRVTGVAAAIVIAAGAWLWTHSPPDSAPPLAPAAPWEQTALLMNEDAYATVGANGMIEMANGASADSAAEAELAEWIVSDLSRATAER